MTTGTPDSGTPFAGNRAEFIDYLGTLRTQGRLAIDDEAAVIRHYDDVLAQVDGAKAELLADYERRRRDDGQDDADRWLREQAEALGRHHGEATRALLDSIDGLAETTQ